MLHVEALGPSLHLSASANQSVPHMDCDDNNLEAWHLKSAVRMAFVGCAALAILITIYFHSIVLK